MLNIYDLHYSSTSKCLFSFGLLFCRLRSEANKEKAHICHFGQFSPKNWVLKTKKWRGVLYGQSIASMFLSKLKMTCKVGPYPFQKIDIVNGEIKT